MGYLINKEEPTMLTSLQAIYNNGGWDSKIKMYSNQRFDDYYTIELFSGGLTTYSACGLTFAQCIQFINDNDIELDQIDRK